MTIRILNATEIPEEDHTPTGVAMWYDRHFRHWVIYPVDAQGTQLTEARYGFSKAEAKQIKTDFEAEIASGNRDGWYY